MKEELRRAMSAQDVLPGSEDPSPHATPPQRERQSSRAGSGTLWSGEASSGARVLLRRSFTGGPGSGGGMRSTFSDGVGSTPSLLLPPGQQDVRSVRLADLPAGNRTWERYE